MSRSMSLFLISIAVLSIGVYLLPRQESATQKQPDSIVNQVAIMYLQMKETQLFQYDSFVKTLKPLGKLSGKPEEMEFAIHFIGYLEGESLELEGTSTLPLWKFLEFLKGEGPAVPEPEEDSLAKLDKSSWIELALLQQCYKKAGKEKQAAETSIKLRFLENKLRKQSRVASFVEIFSLMGLVLLIQGLFQWKAAKKLKWNLFQLDSFPLSLNKLGLFLISFFLLYMVLQLLLAPLGNEVWVLVLGYFLAIFLGWGLLRRLLFPDPNILSEACGLPGLKLTLPVAIHSVFGFCILIFLSHMTVFALNVFQWPLNAEFNEAFFRNMMSSSWNTAGLMLITCVVAPVFEELLFRGIILRSLAHSLSKTQALLWSSLIFALFHPITFFPLIFVLGFSLGLVFMRTKNIMAPIVTHVLWNAFTLIQIQMGV